MKNGWQRPRGKPSLAATIILLLLTGALLYGCVRLVGGMLSSEFRRDDGSASRTRLSASPPPTPSAPEPAPPAAAVYAPTLAPVISPTPGPVLPASPAPSVASVPSPRPTLRPIAEPAAFSESNMDLFLAMFHETGADWISLVSVRDGDCQVLGVPRNAITVAGTAIGEETSPQLLMTKLPGLFPVRYQRYVSISPGGFSQFLTLFGDVPVQGQLLDPDGVNAYLNSGGADELLRLSRQQAVLRGCLVKLRSLTLFDLLKSRAALQSGIESNLTPGQLMDAYTLLKELDPEQVQFSLLPVDSLSIGGKRYYQCDVTLVNGLTDALFPR